MSGGGAAGMRLAYAGTAPFAVLVFERLLAAPHHVAVCLTNPDRPRGRHGTPQPPPMKAAAERVAVAVLQPDTLDDTAPQDELLSHEPDLLVACAYGAIVPQSLLDRLPAVVVHPSMLPRWRGAAPVERALMAGETALGVAIVRMTAGVDEGPLADMRAVEVPRDADAGRAYELLAPVAAAALVAALDAIVAGSVTWCEQEGEPSYAVKLTAADRRIDWRRPAAEIVDRVRALSPRTGAVAELGGRRVLVWRARACDEPAGDGGERLFVPAGEGFVEILELQEEGRRRLPAEAYLRGAGRRLTGR